MGIALLLLGLLPLIFMPEAIDDGAQDDDLSNDSGGLPPPVEIDGDGGDIASLLDDPDDQDGENTDNSTETDGSDILDPNIEIDLPDDGTQNPDPDDILEPVIDIDVLTPSDGNESDILLPVDQINSDSDTIWINFNDDAGLGYSEIEDFQPGQDVLHVLIEPGVVIGALDVDLLQSENGLDTMVYVEQQLVAILKGAADATLGDVIVETGVIAA